MLAESRQKILFGIASMVIAVGIFSIMDAIIKLLAPVYPTVQIVFFRNLFAFLPLGFYLGATGSKLQALRTKRLGGHFLRASYGFVAMCLFFYCYGIMPLVDVIAIGFTAPIFMTILSIWLLKEQVRLHRWSAVIIGFIGMLIMVQPGEAGFGWPAFLALAATLCYALAIVQVRLLSQTEASGTIVFYVTLFATLVSGLILPFVWVAPGLWDFGWLVLIGILGGLGQILLTSAFRFAPVAVIAPFDYMALLWGGLLGWLFWNEVPRIETLIGAAIVIFSGLYILHRETRRHRIEQAGLPSA